MVLALTASCSNELDEDDLVESYQTSHDDAGAELASCVVGSLVDQYEVAGVQAELEAVTPSAAFVESQYRAQFHCGQTDDVQAQLTEMLIERDLSDEQADCVAAALVGQLDDADLDVLMRGTMTDQFFDKYFEATYDCDALPG